jgi:hypothetical protein
MEDWIAWHFDSKGFFFVKSAYRPGVSLRDKDQQRDVGTSSASYGNFTSLEKYLGIEVT